MPVCINLHFFCLETHNYLALAFDMLCLCLEFVYVLFQQLNWPLYSVMYNFILVSVSKHIQVIHAYCVHCCFRLQLCALQLCAWVFVCVRHGWKVPGVGWKTPDHWTQDGREAEVPAIVLENPPPDSDWLRQSTMVRQLQGFSLALWKATPLLFQKCFRRQVCVERTIN